MNPFSLAKKIFDAKTGKDPIDQDVDHGLPFKAKVGSLITLNVSPFLRAEGTLVKAPDRMQTVVAISRLRMPMDGKLYRLYLTKGDDASEMESFIQVYMTAKGDIDELQYYQRMLRMYPETEVDYNLFTGRSEEGLGFKEFSLWKEQMAGIGYDEVLLDEAFGDEEQLVFERQIPGADFLRPFTATENRIDNSAGSEGLLQEVIFMPYVRELESGGQELLLLSAETVKEQNHRQKQEVHVDFMIGVPLTESDVSIQ